MFHEQSEPAGIREDDGPGASGGHAVHLGTPFATSFQAAASTFSADREETTVMANKRNKIPNGEKAKKRERVHVDVVRQVGALTVQPES